MIADYHDDLSSYMALISKLDFEVLPEHLKAEFHAVANSCIPEQDDFIFLTSSFGDALDLQNKYYRFEKNRSRSEVRDHDVFMWSAGVCEKEDIDELFEIQNGCCYYTGVALSKKPKNYEIDHIVPVASRGNSWPGNLALALKSVNSDKGWVSKRTFLTKLEKERGREWMLEQK